MFTQDPDNQARARMMFGFYDVNASIGKVIGSGESAQVDLEVYLEGNGSTLFGASVVVGIGNTIVLGTLQLPDDQALILTVRAELAG